MGWWRCHLAQGPLAVPMQHFDHGCWDLNWKLFQWIIVSILSLIIQFGLQVGFWCSNNALTFFNFEIILVANPDYWGSIVNLKILGLRLGCCCYSFSSHCTSCSPHPPPSPFFFWDPDYLWIYLAGMGAKGFGAHTKSSNVKVILNGGQRVTFLRHDGSFSLYPIFPHLD